MESKQNSELIDIDWGCEFGHELVLATPYAYWLHCNGRLGKTRSAYDTKCLYYFNPNHEAIYDHRASGWNLKRNPHQEQLDTSEWTPPPYKEHYKNDKFVFDKPIFIIANKYCIEWANPPKNWIDIPTLRKLFGLLCPTYQIIYNNPGATPSVFVPDGQDAYDLGEMPIIKKEYPDVILMQDLHKHGGLTWNETQMMVYANCDKFISIQGGMSILGSYFGGENLIYAVHGNEITFHAYENWYNKLSGAKVWHVENYDSLISEAARMI